MLTLTIDTSFLRDWLFIKNVLIDRDYQPGEKTHKRLEGQADKINALAVNRVIDLAITSLSMTELDIDTPPWPINAVISTTLESPQDVSENFPLLKILGSRQTDPDKNQKRARQLLAHLNAKRDYFITSDKAILQVSKDLEASAGIKALTFFDFQKMISTIS